MRDQEAVAISQAWDRLLATRALLGGNVAYMPYVGADPVYSPAYVQAFSSLLLIDLATILDEALAEAETNGRIKPAKPDLNHRILTAETAGMIKNASSLHAMRKLRNEVAHDRNRLIDFTDLDPHLREVYEALSALGYRVRPPINFVLEVSRPAEWMIHPVEVTSNGKAEPTQAWERETVIGIRTPNLPFKYLARYRYKLAVGHDPATATMRRYSFGRWEWR
ncbi:MAG: hypothetical protein ACREBC_30250 [Pyrinomonadaceae bacterium]